MFQDDMKIMQIKKTKLLFLEDLMFQWEKLRNCQDWSQWEGLTPPNIATVQNLNLQAGQDQNTDTKTGIRPAKLQTDWTKSVQKVRMKGA